MIPKKIHYCWFGPNPLNRTAKNCIKSWKKYLPDYELILWNEGNSPMDHPFVEAAYKEKKYAFVADYVRLWALFHEGGIYLDTDMLLLQPIDKFRNNPCFLGEQEKGAIAAGIIGVTKHNEFIKACLDYYDSVEFDKNKLSDIAIPIIMQKVYNVFPQKDLVQIYDSSFFYPYPFEARTNGDLNFWKYIKPESIAVHLWDASWIPEFSEIMGKVNTNKLTFWYNIIHKNIIKLLYG